MSRNSASVYKFSYNDHAWMDEACDHESALEEGMLREAKKQEWTLMQQEGWHFLGGSFQEFEGHHCDNEIYAVLSKTHGGP